MGEGSAIKVIISKKKLKTHTKSRTGCKNCKVRKVKCDETKPSCQKCQLYGVCCSYGSNTLLEPQLEQTRLNTSPSIEASKGVLLTQQCSPRQSMWRMLNDTIDGHNRQRHVRHRMPPMNLEDFARLERFQGRTVLSIGTANTGPVYQAQVIKLVGQHPYLMHAVMTIACMHDRFLVDGVRSTCSTVESYHYGQAAASFRQKLSRHVPATDHDGIWATCAILGCISFFSVDVTDPEDSWPLRDSPSDLKWLEVLEGIHVVWAIVKPTRAGSAFEKLFGDPSKRQLLEARHTTMQIPAIPDALAGLCEVDSSSTTENNPYLKALHLITPMLEKTCTQNTFLAYIGFTGHMHRDFKQLLHSKDARALLIMAYWYAKNCRSAPWFLVTRALIECRAICLYLERHYPPDSRLQQMLVFPKTECGLLTAENLVLTPVSLESGDISNG